jgi:hypothetical protein
MKAVQIFFEERLLEALDADEKVKRQGRSVVLQQLASEYLHKRRDQQIREEYQQAYKASSDLGPEWEGWEDEAQWSPGAATGRPSQPRMRDQLAKIRRDCSTLPVLEDGSPDEILGYDEAGLPT